MVISNWSLMGWALFKHTSWRILNQMIIQQAKENSKGVWRNEETVLDSSVSYNSFMVDFGAYGSGNKQCYLLIALVQCVLWNVWQLLINQRLLYLYYGCCQSWKYSSCLSKGFTIKVKSIRFFIKCAEKQHTYSACPSRQDSSGIFSFLLASHVGTKMLLIFCAWSACIFVCKQLSDVAITGPIKHSK